jgi:hypothetical protein
VARKIDIVPLTDELIQRFGPEIRPADAKEIWVMGRRLPSESARMSASVSDESWCFLIDSFPAAVFGLAPMGLLGDTGCPWVLTGDRVESAKVSFYKASLMVLDRFLRKYSILANAIMEGNVRALDWAESLGFQIFDAIPIGHAGELFHPIMMIRD